MNDFNKQWEHVQEGKKALNYILFQTVLSKNCSKPLQNVILGKHAKTKERETSKVIFRLSFVPLMQIQSFRAAVSNFVLAYPGGYVENLAKYSIH